MNTHPMHGVTWFLAQREHINPSRTSKIKQNQQSWIQKYSRVSKIQTNCQKQKTKTKNVTATNGRRVSLLICRTSMVNSKKAEDSKTKKKSKQNRTN